MGASGITIAAGVGAPTVRIKTVSEGNIWTVVLGNDGLAVVNRHHDSAVFGWLIPFYVKPRKWIHGVPSGALLHSK